jgi:hypothetical protein
MNANGKGSAGVPPSHEAAAGKPARPWMSFKGFSFHDRTLGRHSAGMRADPFLPLAERHRRGRAFAPHWLCCLGEAALPIPRATRGTWAAGLRWQSRRGRAATPYRVELPAWNCWTRAGISRVLGKGRVVARLRQAAGSALSPRAHDKEKEKGGKPVSGGTAYRAPRFRRPLACSLGEGAPPLMPMSYGRRRMFRKTHTQWNTAIFGGCAAN